MDFSGITGGSTVARRRSSKSGQVDVGVLVLIIGLLVSCAALLVKYGIALGKWYINAWKAADRRGRVLLGGGLALVLITMCGLGSGGTPNANSNRSRSSVGQAVAAAPNNLQHAAKATPTSSPKASATVAVPTATAIPPTLTPTAAPPVGQAIKSGNMRSAPKIANDTVLGQLCADDELEYVSRQEIDDDLWYLVRVTKRPVECGQSAVEVGSEGWVNTILVSKPSYAIETYASQAGIRLPAKILSPTSTPKPRPTTAPAKPSSGGRVGAICRDGTRSYATGRGACSHHGGVSYWLYR